MKTLNELLSKLMFWREHKNLTTYEVNFYYKGFMANNYLIHSAKINADPTEIEKLCHEEYCHWFECGGSSKEYTDYYGRYWGTWEVLE